MCEIFWAAQQSKWSKSALGFRAHNSQTTDRHETNIADTLKLRYHIPACSIVNAPSARKMFMKAVISSPDERGVYEFKSASFSSQSTSEANNLRSISSWVEFYGKFNIFEKS